MARTYLLRFSLVTLALALIAGCGSVENSPLVNNAVVSVLSGESTLDEAGDRIRLANEQAHAEENRELREDTVRAYNTKTDEFEFVAFDTVQRWNDEEQRWEFTPIEDED